MAQTKYGNIKELYEEVKTEIVEENLETKEVEVKDTDTKIVEQVQEKTTRKSTESSTKIVTNQQVKKTYEINLTWEVALELLKNERKQQKRFVNSNKSATSNGILNEIFEEYFSKKENKKYLESAQEIIKSA